MDVHRRETNDQPQNDTSSEQYELLLSPTAEQNSIPDDTSTIHFTDSAGSDYPEEMDHAAVGGKHAQVTMLPDAASRTNSKAVSNRSRVFPPWSHPLWLWEYLIIAFSVGCMAAIAIVLLALHGKRLSSWNLPISPNALISVFATISKSTMLWALAEGISQLKWVYFRRRSQRLKHFQIFDDASRGPWGAVKLIFRIGFGAWFASAGAVIVILSLAMDPFVQQVLTFRTHMIPAHNATAGIGMASMFDSGIRRVPDAFQTTYPPVSSSDEMTIPASDLLNSLVRGIFASDTNTDYSCPTGNCTWQLFDSLGVCSDCTESKEKDVCNEIGCLFKSTSPDPYVNETLYAYAAADFDCNDSGFANIAIVYRDDSVRDWYGMPAYNCTLSFCRKTYNHSSYSMGNLYDEPTSSDALVPWPQAPNITTNMVNTDYLCPFRTSEDGQRNNSDATPYWINQIDVNTVGNALAPLFWTTLLTSLGANNYVASALYRRNGGDIPATMDSVATSMTNQIRQGPNTTTVQGTALIPQVYINVSWPWLILPASLVLLSSGFLALTANLLTEKGDVVWKSSTLATLFHGLHGLGSEEAKLMSMRSMSDAADEIYALLGSDDDGQTALLCSEKGEAVQGKEQSRGKP